MVHKQDPEERIFCPGNHGENCQWNGKKQENECLCDECDHYLICFPDWKEPDFYERLQSTV